MMKIPPQKEKYGNAIGENDPPIRETGNGLCMSHHNSKHSYPLHDVEDRIPF
jgi:hypothetical protein